jgi:excisionase family DNA binding protein
MVKEPTSEGKSPNDRAVMGGNGGPKLNVAYPIKLAFQMKEAAVASGICKAKLYQEIKAGRLKSVKVCGRRLILKNDLEQFLQAA